MRFRHSAGEPTIKSAKVIGGAFATALLLLAVAAGYRMLQRAARLAAPASRATAPSTAPASPGITPSAALPAAAATYQGFLYGRVTTVGSPTYEGRLRFGAGEEAFWGHYFNGYKKGNPWAAHVPPQRLPKERRAVEILGIEIFHKEQPLPFGRPFMTRFGDIRRIEARGRDVRVTLKSGTVFELDRMDASDFDDGVRVWDRRRGLVDLDSLRIRAIDFLPTAPLGAVPDQLHGTVRTRQGEFTGFMQWNRSEGTGSDELHGKTAEGKLSLRFDTVRSIARRAHANSLVTLLDGREIEISGIEVVGDGNRRGIHVDDRRYGRVLISWDAFERVDFSPGGSGPAYASFPPGRPLTGTVTIHAGGRLAGRLVYDLDESETTETLDAQSQGVDYTIPFGLIASIVPLDPDAGGVHRAKVVLHSGEELELEGGDVGVRHGGVLVFTGDRKHPDYLHWEEVERIDFEGPPLISAPLP